MSARRSLVLTTIAISTLLLVEPVRFVVLYTVNSEIVVDKLLDISHAGADRLRAGSGRVIKVDRIGDSIVLGTSTNYRVNKDYILAKCKDDLCIIDHVDLRILQVCISIIVILSFKVVCGSMVYRRTIFN